MWRRLCMASSTSLSALSFYDDEDQGPKMLIPTGETTRKEGEVTGPKVPPFALLFAEHSRRVWRTLRRLGVRESDAEDVCQEVFVVIHRKLPEYRRDSSLTTWIYGICMRAASDYRRRAHIRRESAAAEPPDQPVNAEQEESAARREALIVLDRLLVELDEDKRAVFVLFDLEELPMADVARILGCPPQTAYYRLYAARREIETKIAAHAALEGGS